MLGTFSRYADMPTEAVERIEFTPEQIAERERHIWKFVGSRPVFGPFSRMKKPVSHS